MRISPGGAILRFAAARHLLTVFVTLSAYPTMLSTRINIYGIFVPSMVIILFYKKIRMVIILKTRSYQGPFLMVGEVGIFNAKMVLISKNF